MPLCKASDVQEDTYEVVLFEELLRGRQLTDALFKNIPEELLYHRPIPERHRVIFYIGHLEAFDANLLQCGYKKLSASEESFNRLFAFGIDPVDGGLPKDRPQDWPTITEIQWYIDETRHRLDRQLWDFPGGGIGDTSLARLLNVAIEHRLMHAETLAYLFNQLPASNTVRGSANASSRIGDGEMVSIPPGNVTLGMDTRSVSFAWDNEYPKNTACVPSFCIDKYMVTNNQFNQFVEAGGYEERGCWNAKDWEWRSAIKLTHPAAWVDAPEGWQLRSLFSAIPMQPDWPVYVSHAEAVAYAKWIGKQLPSEAQWHRAAYGTASDMERQYPWGDTAPSDCHGNFNFTRWDPASVDAHPDGDSAFGVAGMVGNGWEWTCTPFHAFQGFEPYPFYPGYSVDFFDGEHFVLKGGSQCTAKRLLRRSFRNWFQPHYPYPFAGFRCVR